MENEPIRVAHIIGRMVAGGVENVVFNYYRNIDKSKVQFDIYYDTDSTVSPDIKLIEMGARFYQIPSYKHIFSYMKELIKHFRENNYTIVHSHMNTLSVFSLCCAKIAGVPVRIAHNHSVPGKGEFLRNSLKYILRLGCKWFSTDYFACSESAGQWMFSNKTFDSGKVRVINNAIDFARFTPNEDVRNALISELSLEGKFVLGHVGRYTFAKNHAFLLDIFNALHKKLPDSVLLLVGEGELKDEIDLKIKDLLLSDSVIQIDNTPTPENYYPLMSVFCMPSCFEGLPLTAVEAQICGVPCLLSDVITKEVLINNNCEFMNIALSADEWADAILNIANKKSELNENSKKFDIKYASPILENWYIERIEKINKR